jgi:hypothetical protein
MTLPSPLPIRVQIGTPAQKKCFNLRLFTRVADEYDLATRAMSLGQDARWKRRLLELLPVMDRPRCVDLACGTGDLTLGLAGRGNTGQFVCLPVWKARWHCSNVDRTARGAMFSHQAAAHPSSLGIRIRL